MNSEQNYILDFVIPSGPTGPQGSGIQSIIFIEYNNSSNGNPTMSQINLNPNNSTYFSINNNLISINKTGYYEITISGLLKETSPHTSPSIIVQTSYGVNTENLITISLGNETDEIYFCQRKILECSIMQNISIIFLKSNNSNASLEQLNLIIKKLVI